MRLGDKLLTWLETVYKEPFATKANDWSSEPIFLTRGVRQESPLSPLDSSMVALAISFRKDTLITGPSCKGREFKLAQYTDDDGQIQASHFQHC